MGYDFMVPQYSGPMNHLIRDSLRRRLQALQAAAQIQHAIAGVEVYDNSLSIQQRDGDRMTPSRHMIELALACACEKVLEAADLITCPKRFDLGIR